MSSASAPPGGIPRIVLQYLFNGAGIYIGADNFQTLFAAKIDEF
jgi:hypothetical protein